MHKTPVVISGSTAIDRIMSFGGKYSEIIQPENIGVLSVSTFLDSLQDVHGGVGANIAYSMALLGDETFLVGSVGPDCTGYMEELAHAGVNISHVYESKLPTGSFNVFTDADQNQIAGFYPGAMFDSDTLSLAPFKDMSPIIIISPQDPRSMKRQVAEAAEWGLRLCYDVGQQVSNISSEDMREGIHAAEILILNEYEIGVLSQKTGLSIEEIKQTVPVVITTYGKKGSVIEGKTVPNAITVGIATPKKVLDPTGAGDAFRAGLLYGMSRDWPLKVSAQLGAVTSSFAVEHVGTQAHNFTLDDVKTRYATAFNESLPPE